MATRSVIQFYDENAKTPTSQVYRFWDGYPDGESGVLADLRRFFKDVEAQTEDPGYYDPEYLATKFIVWQANENAKIANKRDRQDARKNGTKAKTGMLNFIGLGVTDRIDRDVAYIYEIRCRPARGKVVRPLIAYRRQSGKRLTKVR